MNTFTDSTGYVWNVVIDDEAIKNVAVLAKINLLDLWGEPNALQRISDPKNFFIVLYLLCAIQCKTKNLSSIEFVKRVPSSGEAVTAFLQEYVSMLLQKFPMMKDKIFAAMVNMVRTGTIKGILAPGNN